MPSPSFRTGGCVQASAAPLPHPNPYHPPLPSPSLSPLPSRKFLPYCCRCCHYHQLHLALLVDADIASPIATSVLLTVQVHGCTDIIAPTDCVCPAIDATQQLTRRKRPLELRCSCGLSGTLPSSLFPSRAPSPDSVRRLSLRSAQAQVVPKTSCRLL